MSEHNFVVSKKGDMNILKELYYKNFGEKLTDFISICEYWCTLYSKDDIILAECSIEHIDKNLFEIHDVFVDEKFRGNNYAVLLILNTILYIKDNFPESDIEIKCYTVNKSAYSCYSKIFGDPYFEDDDFTYFIFNTIQHPN